MKHILTVLFGILYISNLNAQQSMEDKEIQAINKWLMATINIECEVHNDDGAEDALFKKFSKKEITKEEYLEGLKKIAFSRERPNGTGIFLKHNDNYYIITARHVIIDTTSKDFSGRPRIGRKIFVIPHSNSDLSKDITPSLMNLSAGPEGMRPYLLSDETVDLAVVRIPSDFSGSNFVKLLLSTGYQPVSIDDVSSDFNLKENDKLIILGYPSWLSRMPVGQSFESINWSPWARSLPVVTKGRVADIPPNQYSFFADIQADHGNSGGPIIHNNKLVGIVSAFEPVSRQGNTALTSYIDLKTKLIKTPLIIRMIKALDKNGGN